MTNLKWHVVVSSHVVACAPNNKTPSKLACPYYTRGCEESFVASNISTEIRFSFICVISLLMWSLHYCQSKETFDILFRVRQAIVMLKVSVIGSSTLPLLDIQMQIANLGYH